MEHDVGCIIDSWDMGFGGIEELDNVAELDMNGFFWRVNCE